MKKSMTVMIAMVFAFGMNVTVHAAQPEQKSGQERIRVVYPDPAKKCDGLTGGARSVCLKDVQRQGRGSGMKAVPDAPDAKK